MKYTKSACFTDIHFGLRSNCQQHNEDCEAFVDWFIEQIDKEGGVDHIVFLGDWHDNRSTINISTLKYSYNCAKKLNDVGVPIFFLVGNHDLYHRFSRDIHSVVHFSEFENFVVIDEPTVVDKKFFCPFVFTNENEMLSKYNKTPVWYGHFEFNDFVITGHNIVMENGLNCDDLTGPARIFSGHFHKRQTKGNVTYIGNTFPMNFGDCGDNERGMMIYDYAEDVAKFIDWEKCPKFIKCNLTTLMDQYKDLLVPNSVVRCIVDYPVTFEDSVRLKEKFVEEYSLREFVFDEGDIVKQSISDTEVDQDEDEFVCVDDMVVEMLKNLDTPNIDNDQLIKIYTGLY